MSDVPGNPDKTMNVYYVDERWNDGLVHALVPNTVLAKAFPWAGVCVQIIVAGNEDGLRKTNDPVNCLQCLSNPRYRP